MLLRPTSVTARPGYYSTILTQDVRLLKTLFFLLEPNQVQEGLGPTQWTDKMSNAVATVTILVLLGMSTAVSAFNSLHLPVRGGRTAAHSGINFEKL